jgi:ribose transport system permease protein
MKKPLGVIKKIGGSQQVGIVLIIVILLLASEAVNPATLSFSNVIELLRATAEYFIAACGATLLLVGGGLDLSVGSVFAAGGVAVGFFMLIGVPWPVAIVLAVVVAGLFGLANGLLVTRAKIPPFIATLGMYFAVSGIIIVSTNGSPLSGFPIGFGDVAQLNLFGVPLPLYYALIIGIVFHMVLQSSRFGYDTRAVGGNSNAALANGVRVRRVTISLYVISSGIAGLAGVLLASRLSAADPSAGGTGFTFQVLAAVIIGGTSLFGGVGTIAGTALGSVLFSVINDALALTNVNPQWANIVTGVILILAVVLDQVRRTRRFRTARRA